MTEQLPSKDVIPLIQHLIYCVNGCEFNGMPNTADACRKAIAEIDRLRVALTGISTCSTCEACRGAAALALGDWEVTCRPLMHIFREQGKPCVCGVVPWGQPSNTPEEIDRLNADMAWIRRRTGFWGEVPKDQAETVVDCETCRGTGTIDETLGGEFFSNPSAPCPDCDGLGEFTRAAQPPRDGWDANGSPV